MELIIRLTPVHWFERLPLKKGTLILWSVCSLLLSSCQSPSETVPFDANLWKLKTKNGYTHREFMVHDVMTRKDIRERSTEEMILLLGIPDRRVDQYLYYTIRETRMGFITLHMKTLVILFNENDEVEWMKLHQ